MGGPVFRGLSWWADWVVALAGMVFAVGLLLLMRRRGATRAGLHLSIVGSALMLALLVYITGREIIVLRISTARMADSFIPILLIVCLQAVSFAISGMVLASDDAQERFGAASSHSHRRLRLCLHALALSSTAITLIAIAIAVLS